MIDELTQPNESSVQVESTKASETPEDKAKREADEKVLDIARRRLHAGLRATTHFRTQAADDAKFAAGTWGKVSHQWPSGIQGDREAAGRPCFTINRMPGFIRQVTNQARAANLRILVSPVDDKGDPKTAEVLQGLIRNTETTSFADRAYNMGSMKQAEQGRGFFRFVTEWAESDRGFRQRIRIERERNPLSVVTDPTAQRADGTDGKWQFKLTDIDRVEYQETTGHEPPAENALGTTDIGMELTGDWFPNGKVRVVEYWSREPRGPKREIALLSNGAEVDAPDEAQTAEFKKQGIAVLKRRPVQKIVTVARKLDAERIHFETIWPADGPGPFIPVLGDEYLSDDGELDFRGVVRDSKEPARIYNVETTALYEQVAKGVKSPVVGYAGQFGAPESAMRKRWEQANQVPFPFLEVEPVEVGGQLAPLPQPVHYEMPLEGTMLAITHSDEDLKTIAGFHDASMGERGPQESGKAITARQRQDELGSSHYLDNLRFAIAAGGRQLIQLIRSVYDEPTVIRITGDDDQQKKVMVFSGTERDPRQAKFQQDGAEPWKLPEGVEGIYDISVGEFDVEVTAGPSPGSRRQEEMQIVDDAFKNMPPEIAAKYLDLRFKLIDSAIGRQLAERAKKMLPPELQDAQDGQAPIPPQVQQQVAQMKQKLDEQMQVIQGLQEAIKTDQAKGEAAIKAKVIDVQSREKIAQLQTDAKVHIEQQKLSVEERLATMEANMKHLTDLATLNHDARMAWESRQHDKATGDAEAQHEHDLLTREHAHARATGAAEAERAAEQSQADRDAAAATQRTGDETV